MIQIAKLRFRFARRRFVERLLRRFVSRSRAARIAHFVP
jgi:hypothetical protein